MSKDLGSILSNLNRQERKEKINERYYMDSEAFKRGMRAVENIIEEEIDDIINNIIDMLDREDFAEEELAEYILIFISEEIAQLSFDRNKLKEMKEYVEDCLDNPYKW